MITERCLQRRYPQLLKRYPLKYPLMIADAGELQ